MPGILPMKVIKVGASSQSRIAQACDRCRSKKIRCDGTRPTCSQCANVGFECRTSDKLSRRAFPRGYTESLEERVRQLEGEIRQLTDLLDEKDDKIEMLSKMHGNRRRLSTASRSEVDAVRASSGVQAGAFKVQAAPLLLDPEGSDCYVMGTSSGRSFIESFKQRLQEKGHGDTDFNPDGFFFFFSSPAQDYPTPAHDVPSSSSGTLPRLLTDRCINVYFQEWAALFPVLHKPSFLTVYEEFTADSGKMTSSFKLAQLHLVFGIASLSSRDADPSLVAACEREWTAALGCIITENTMDALQCLVLALLYSSLKADYDKLQHYRAIAVGLAHRLGLHQSQKRLSLGALTMEMRKRVFWTLYSLDCFASAAMGLPKLLREEDIQAEYPSDIDDEYVTEKGFLPSLPGEHTRLSNALALFKASRILANVLLQNYSTAATHELSLQSMEAFASELDDWYHGLPPHLKLNFVQDKPSTDVTGSRSPLLALAYYFIRTLIYRQAVGSSLGDEAAPALLSISNASKHMVQITQLLEERDLSFAFCLNKPNLLTLCGFTLLYHAMEVKKDSKLARDIERLVSSIIETLVRLQTPGCLQFRRIAHILIKVEDLSAEPSKSRVAVQDGFFSPAEGALNMQPVPQSRGNDGLAPASASAPALASHSRALPSDKRNRNVSFSTFDPRGSEVDINIQHQQERLRRMTLPRSIGDSDSRSQQVSAHPSKASMQQRFVDRPPPLDNSRANFEPPSRDDDDDPSGFRLPPTKPSDVSSGQSKASFAAGQVTGRLSGVSPLEWETLLGSMEGGRYNMYNAIYGGQDFLSEDPPPHPVAKPSRTSEWSSEAWRADGLVDTEDSAANKPATQSLLSLSGEEAALLGYFGNMEDGRAST